MQASPLGSPTATGRVRRYFAVLAATGALVTVSAALAEQPGSLSSSSEVGHPDPEVATPARDARPVLFVVRRAGDETLLDALGLEAQRFGWALEAVDAEPASPPVDVPVAIVVYLGRGLGVRVWIRGAGKLALPAEDTVDPVDPRADDVLAIRTAEVVRAHFLLPRNALPEPREASAAVPAAPRLEPKSLPQRSGPKLFGELGLGGAVVGSPGGVPPIVGLALAGKLGIGDWALAVFGIVPVRPASLSEPEGDAKVRTVGAQAAVLRQFELTRRLHLSAGLGGAVWAVDIEGTARAPYVSRSSVVVTGGPVGVLALETSVTQILRLGLAASGGVGIPPVSVRFAERDAARWGEPFGTLAVYGALRF